MPQFSRRDAETPRQLDQATTKPCSGAPALILGGAIRQWLHMFKALSLALAVSLFTLAGCAADTSPEDPASTEAPAPIGSDQVDPAYAISCPPPVYQCFATKISYTTFAACASACKTTAYPGMCQTVYPYCYGVPPRAPK